jgi:hypothetical protein
LAAKSFRKSAFIVPFRPTWSSEISPCQRDDRHAGEAQVLEEGRDVGLVATDPVERLRQHEVELPGLRVLKERLDAGAQDHAGAGDRRVLVGADDLPALALRLLAANAKLVLDRSVALVVGGIAGVERDAGHPDALSAAHGAGLLLPGEVEEPGLDPGEEARREEAVGEGAGLARHRVNADLNLPRSAEAKFPTSAVGDQPVSDRWLRTSAACRGVWVAVAA